MAGRWLILFAALAPGVMLSGCAGGSPASSGARGQGAVKLRSNQARVIESVPARCDVGERPDYFVPATSPAALLGCARLGVSGKRVEFSGALGRIGREFHLCINTAYGGGRRRGAYIPAVCKLSPPPPRFATRYARQPRQAVRGYEYVIWGTAQAATSDVVARFNSGMARAAVFKVPSNRAPWTFGERPFALFVFELPLAAACDSVTVAGHGPDATARIPRRARLCERSRGSGAGRPR